MPFWPSVGVGTRMPEPPAPRTSLLPIQIVVKVGWAISARDTCVLPPRMNVVSALDSLVVALVGSAEYAPGTATLFRMSVTDVLTRSAHAGGVVAPAGRPVSTRACVWKFATG